MKIKVYIGYDPREHEAAMVCRSSILRRGSLRVNREAIEFLNDRELRQSGLFTRPYRVTSSGQFVDIRDGKPFSTMFSHSRFLVPSLAKRDGVDWALFCDCDFIFSQPIDHLFELADARYALMCVKHQHTVGESESKMDGVAQQNYGRKNWSSLMLFNMNHAAHDEVMKPAKWKKKKGSTVAPYAPNYAKGAWLHGLGWLFADQIGELPESWNWLVGTSPTTELKRVYSDSHPPAGIHYTSGGPWMKGYENVRWANLWKKEREYGEIHGLLR